MRYVVIKEFFDLQDNLRPGGIPAYYHYLPGDTYPRTGYTPTPARIAELASRRNACRRPVIRERDEEPAAKPARTKRRKKGGGTDGTA